MGYKEDVITVAKALIEESIEHYKSGYSFNLITKNLLVGEKNV